MLKYFGLLFMFARNNTHKNKKKIKKTWVYFIKLSIANTTVTGISMDNLWTDNDKEKQKCFEKNLFCKCQFIDYKSHAECHNTEWSHQPHHYENLKIHITEEPSNKEPYLLFNSPLWANLKE
jgi:hypothetical protein